MVKHTNTTRTSPTRKAIMEKPLNPLQALGRTFMGEGSSLRPLNARTATLLALLTIVLSMAVPSPTLAAECPNEEIRLEQHIAGTLADCRAYEQVSPEEKGHGDIIADGETTIAATTGEAVAYSTRTPFGDEVGSGVSGQTQYVARRTNDGWTSHAVTPTPLPDTVQTFFSATKLQTFSDDLTSAVVWGYDLPGGGGEPARNNIYLENTATRALQPITLSQTENKLSPFDFLTTTDWGTSADAQHLAFVTSTQMLPNAAPGVPNVYEWDAGRELSLAGILPDGTVPSGGSDVQPNHYRAAMSADGRRLVFTAAPNGDPELYMRIDGSTTVPISQPNGDPNSTNVHLQAVTPDGRNVFFVTDSALVPGDVNGGPDLYRWTDSGDPAHDGTITQISTDGEYGLDGTQNGVIGASDDGTVVYYETTDLQLVVWDNGTSRLLSADAAADSDPTNSVAAVASEPGLGRVSPDGMWLAFMTRSTIQNDGIHGLTGEVINGHYEMYVYSLRDDRLSCVSCPSGAARVDASVVPDVTSGLPRLVDDAIRPQFLSTGGKVFFSTGEALVPQDVNGVEDVYEYDAPTGKLSLVSSGTGHDPASFADASPSGDDVFFQTRQQLVPGDHDELVDLYDARVGGGFPEVPVATLTPCLGDACQGSPGSAPSFQVPVSVGFTGPANPNVSVVVQKPVAKRLSRVEKLRKAFMACRARRRRSQREKCEVAARKSFGKRKGA
jgi:hypothetical protein